MRKKLRIKSVEACGINMGAYRYEDNTIFYDKRLDHYPKLKKKVLDHEVYHAKHRDSLLSHMYIDMKDIFFPVTGGYEFYKYYYLESDLPKKKNIRRLTYYYMIFDFFRGLFGVPIFIVSFTTHSIVYITKGVFGKDEER